MVLEASAGPSNRSSGSAGKANTPTPSCQAVPRDCTLESWPGPAKMTVEWTSGGLTMAEPDRKKIAADWAARGFSSTAQHYAIKSAEEARQYLAHPVLGPRLRECAEAVLAVEGRSASEIFGSPDDLKLKSCMTLFESVAGQDSIFGRVLDRYYQ